MLLFFYLIHNELQTNLFSVILDLLAWTALIRLLYCPGLKFDLRFWSYITLIAVIEQIFVYQDKILHYPYVQFDKNTKPNYYKHHTAKEYYRSL